MDWRLKGALQKVLGVVPGGRPIHRFLQRRAGLLADFEGQCDGKVDDWRLMAGHLRAAGMQVPGATLFEIGTGWYPTLPFCLYLIGAGSVVTVDLTRHLSRALTLKLVDRLTVHLPTIATAAGLPETEIAPRLDALSGALRDCASLEDATGGRVRYRAPADARDSGLPAGSVDVVFSNSVLEHVQAPAIEAIFRESMRILRPGGLAFHSANCGDHYAYADRSIHQLNYLRYSPEAWRKWDNAFLFQNRLRAVDFTEMARRAGFTIEIDTSTARPERLAQLAGLQVDPWFARYSREQLAITSVDFVARKPA